MTESPRANIGVVGLAVMGSNLARNLASRDGNRVAIYNRSVERTKTLVNEHPEANFIAAETLDAFVASLTTPRTAIIMVKAGAPTDAVIDQLAKSFEPGDIIVDGGNALFTDTIRREKELRELGINFVGAGISGGEEGALNGPSIMAGGSNEAYQTLGPILESIAAVAKDGEPCVTHVGSDGAGHFVKMIHNGIEYADMQLIAEAYDLLRELGGFTPAAAADVFREWNTGHLESYLIEITSTVLSHVDAETGQPFIDIVLDEAGSKGTGVWTVQNALALGIPVTGIAEAVFARAISSHRDQRDAVQRVIDERPQPETIDDLADDIQAALYASKIVAYAQGFDAIIAGASEFGWNINKADIAKIWRNGCIIRAQFLGRIVDAYEKDADSVSLLVDPYFAEALRNAEAAWRRVVANAALAGIPVPGFSSALAYFDALRSKRLPAALIQGQRDYFGAHTYKRVDRPGVFHTNWSGSRDEISVS